MARRLRQTTKGTTLKIGRGLPEQYHFVCGVFERRVKSRVGICAYNVPFRKHQASRARRVSKPVVSRLGSSSLVGGKTRESAITAPEHGKNRRCQPVGSLVGHLGLQCRLLGTPTLGSLGLLCPLAGAPGLGSMMRILTRGFSHRALSNRWRKLVRNRPHCTRKRARHRRCQPVGSLVGHLGLQCLPLGTPILGTLDLQCLPQEHQASGARRESEPTVSRVVASSLFDV